MKDWYQPDEIWEVLGIKTREDYVHRHVFEARFHAGVPEDIVRAYATVSQLMAQAWHHYPLYDEAITKLLFLIEMAVKLRCGQVGIALTSTTSAGRQRAKHLQKLIDELAQLEPCKARQFEYPLNHARELRNLVAHPAHYSHGGVMLRHQVQPLMNLLNLLFLDEAVVMHSAAHLAQLRQQRAAMGTKLLGLTRKGQSIVLTEAVPLQTHWVQNEWRVIWAFYPLVPDIFEVVSRHQPVPPILLTITGIESTAGVISGKEVATTTPITLEPAPAGLDQVLLSRHNADYQRASEEDRHLFTFLQQSETARLEVEMVYTHFWQ